MTKRQPKTKQKIREIVPEKSPKSEPRTWFSHPKMRQGGPLGPLGSKTPPTWPQDTSKPRLLAHLCAIWSDLSSVRGAYFQKRKMQTSCSLVCARERIFSTTNWNIGNETIKWAGAQPTFLAQWRGCRRHLV